MEVILLEHIDNLGNFGEVVKVKNGFARNYLLPNNKCLRATNENKAYFEAERAKMEQQVAAQVKEAEEKANKINEKFITLIRQAGEDGRLFGAVTTRDVSAELTEKFVEVSKDSVRINTPIKYLGVYPIQISLAGAVKAQVRVNVARSEDEAKEAQELFLNPPKEAKQEEAIEPVKEEAKEAQASDVETENTTEDK